MIRRVWSNGDPGLPASRILAFDQSQHSNDILSQIERRAVTLAHADLRETTVEHPDVKVSG